MTYLILKHLLLLFKTVSSQDLSDIKASFTAIQDSVSQITLDSEVKLKYSTQGITQEQKPLYGVVIKSVKYPEK